MIRTLAHDIAYIAALESLPFLQRAIDGPVNLTPFRQPLNKVYDRLDRALTMMADKDVAEDFDSDYLPIFDAMCFLRDALSRKLVSRDLVERAAAVLAEVKRKGSAA